MNDSTTMKNTIEPGDDIKTSIGRYVESSKLGMKTATISRRSPTHVGPEKMALRWSTRGDEDGETVAVSRIDWDIRGRRMDY